MRWTWFFGFFLVSGFCSLVYEVVWLRLAMAGFGVTTPLVSIVLSVFMAGLALGSWLAGRLGPWLGRRPVADSLKLYAGIELVISASGVTVPYLFDSGRRFLAWMAGDRPLGSGGHYVVSGALVALTLLPFCTGMGATLPLAMSALRRTVGHAAERSFSYLYLANVLGATSGTLASAFVLVEILGFRRTLLVAAGLNVLVAGLAFAVSRVSSAEAARGDDASPGPSMRGLRHGPDGRIPWLLFLTGSASLAMEVVWVRQFTVYLGTVVYAFAGILALYLTATFLGSMLYRIRARSRPTQATGPVAAWAVVGLLGLLPLAAADPYLPLGNGFLPAVLRVALGIGPISGALGYLTPMLVDRWSRGEPLRAGSAYALNVVGGILGPLVAGFGLLPLVGERGALLVLAAPFFGIAGLVALSRSAPAATPARPWPVFAASLALAVLLGGFSRGYESRFHRPVVRRDATATVIAVGEGRSKNLVINGVGTTTLTPITKMMAHLPLAFMPRAPRNGLVICFGMGTSFRSMLSWGIPATAVELTPSVPTLFGYYHEDGPMLVRSPLARVVIDDGRRFLERSRGWYDVIVVDPPPPVGAAGSSLLYSWEFYGTVRKRLPPDGIVQQWVPGSAEPRVLAAVAKALRSAFPHVRVFKSVENWGFHFLASAAPIAGMPARELAGRLPARAVTDLLEWGPGATAEAQFELALSRETLVRHVMLLDRDVPVLQDDFPVNEYYLVRAALSALRSKDGAR